MNLHGFLASNEQHSNKIGIILLVRICQNKIEQFLNECFYTFYSYQQLNRIFTLF